MTKAPMRWSALEIAGATLLAEDNKLDGELPAPRSTFIVTPKETCDIYAGAGLADVVEVRR